MGLKEMTGQKYGRLTIINRAENDKYGNAMWHCVCECGNAVIRNGAYLRNAMKNNQVISCGCYHKKKLLEVNTKHGLSKTRLYKIFHGIKSRCYNFNNIEYIHYGGKGIFICDEWINKENGLSNFIEWALSNGYSDELTIDRIDNNMGYSPDNCRWATREEQNRNTSRVHLVLYNGEYITTAQVAKIIGITRGTAAKWYTNLGFKTFSEFLKRKQENRKNQYA